MSRGKAFLWCPVARLSCGVPWQGLLVVSRGKAYLWCPVARLTCGVPWQGLLVVSRGKAYLWCPVARLSCGVPWQGLLVVSRGKAFSGRPTNSGLTLPGAVHLDGGVIGYHQCITSCSGNAPALPDPLVLSNMHTIRHIYPCPHPTHHRHDQLHTCTNCD